MVIKYVIYLMKDTGIPNEPDCLYALDLYHEPNENELEETIKNWLGNEFDYDYVVIEKQYHRN